MSQVEPSHAISTLSLPGRSATPVTVATAIDAMVPAGARGSDAIADDPGVVFRRAGRGRQKRSRTEHDLIDREPVLTHLDPDRLRLVTAK